MAQHVAFLRAVNVGGNTIVPMAALRDLFGELGFNNARTLLQSGNVVFDAGRASPATVAKKIEGALAKRFAKDIRVILRTPDALRGVVARNPFPAAARDDPGHLLVTFLAEAPAAAAVKALAGWKHATEPHKVDGRELYTHYRSGAGTSKFAGPTIEKTLGTTGTARNWNTINKLIALAGEIKDS